MDRTVTGLVIAVLVLGAASHLNGCASRSDRSAIESTAQVAHEVDLTEHFGDRDGAFVLRNIETGETWRHNTALCAQRFAPCSTFKIVNALIALDTGVATDGHMVITWDGVERSRAALNRDHTLRTAIRDSVLWYFQIIAERIGMERMQRAIDRIGYGNGDLTGGITQFWLGRSLAISPNEQAALLARLDRGDLPVSRRSMAIVLDAMTLESGNSYTHRGKSGSCDGPGDHDHGWFVGIVERPGSTWAYACLIVGPRAWGFNEGRTIAMSVLRSRGLLE